MASSPIPQVQGFFDAVTGTISYVVFDQVAGHAAIIDSVLDYDAKSGRTSTRSADALIAFVREQQLQVDWLLETHAHADHLSAAAYLHKQLGGQRAIGAKITQVQQLFRPIFNPGADYHTDGQPFERLLHDQDTLPLGQLSLRALELPGHTPADLAYQVGDAVFVGDTLFMPDVGTARCDFPGGDAQALYHSVQKLLALPADTRLFLCHDYPPEGRAPQWQTSVAEQRLGNIHLRPEVSEADFVAMRQARDAQLSMPLLILPSIQVNLRAGEFPAAETNGVSYLKIPLNRL